MREKINNQTEFGFKLPCEKNPKAKTYEAIEKILDDNPDIEKLVREDLIKELKVPDTGRNGITPAQTIRFVIVKQIEKKSYRGLFSEIADSFALRNFCKILDGEVPSFEAMNDSIKKLRPETLEKINRIIVLYACNKGIEKARTIRLDSTAVESNIHYPTDNSLIWDCVRFATNLAQAAKELVLGDKYYFPK